MGILVVLAVVIVVAAVIVQRRGRDTRDPVDTQREQLDALAAAVAAADTPRSPGGTAGRVDASRWRGILVALTGGVLALGLVGGVIALGGGSGPDTRDDPGSAGSRGGGSASSSSSSTTTSVPTTTTTSPATVISDEGGVLTVAVGAETYEIRLVARAACWMQFAQAGGEVIDVATLRADETRELAGVGATTLRLGNPGVVAVTVDGQPIDTAARGGAPLDIHFVPPSSVPPSSVPPSSVPSDSGSPS